MRLSPWQCVEGPCVRAFSLLPKQQAEGGGVDYFGARSDGVVWSVSVRAQQQVCEVADCLASVVRKQIVLV